MRAYLFAAGLLLVIFGSLGTYQYLRISAFAAQNFTPPPVTIAAGYASTESWTRYLEAIGTIKAVRGIELTSEASGEITRINFRSGDQVSAGQELVTLNDDIEQATRLNRVAGLELAGILFERDRKLFERKSLPESTFDRSRAALAQARAQLAESEARIRHKHIQAPFDGVIGIRLVDVGDYIDPGTPIATLQDLSELEVDFTLPARYTPQLKPGQTLQLQTSAFPERIFAATLRALDSQVDARTMNLLARARIERGEGLLPGMFANLKIALGQEQDTVTVTETAVTFSLNGSTVYVLSPGENQVLNAIPRVVETGEVRAGRVEIRSGLAPGEQVVTAGQNKLYRGAAVRIDPSVKL